MDVGVVVPVEGVVDVEDVGVDEETPGGVRGGVGVYMREGVGCLKGWGCEGS